MKAIEYTQYGSPEVLRMIEMEKPSPAANEVRIKIHATTVTSGDVRSRSSTFPASMWLIGRLMMGFRRPRQTILGSELAGVVESVGSDVTRFQPGDAVFAAVGFGPGAYAEYVCLPEDGPLALKPDDLSFEQAAAIPVGAATATYFLQQANIQSGQKVLVVGASGSMGTYAVQIAKHFGAQVTGVCSTANLDMVRSLGADHVIDYTQEDFTRNGETYDVIFDTVGAASFGTCKRSLNPNGIFLAGSGGLSVFFQMGWTALVGNKKVIAGISMPKTDDIEYLKELFETGAFKPVIDRCYPFEQIAEAHRYVDTGRKKGNVVIAVEPRGSAHVSPSNHL